MRQTGKQGSAILTSTVKANCFIVLPESQGPVTAGDEVMDELCKDLKRSPTQSKTKKSQEITAHLRRLIVSTLFAQLNLLKFDANFPAQQLTHHIIDKPITQNEGP